MKRVLITLLFALVFSALPAQYTQNNIDSLMNELRDSPRDTNRALTLLNVCRFYQNSDVDSLTKYANICIELSDDLEFPKGQGNGHIMLGIAFMYEGNYPLSLHEFEIAYGYYEQIGSVKGMANSLNNNALVYSNTGQYDLALDNQLRAMELYKQIGNGMMQANSLNNMGLMYINQERYDEAFPWLMQAVKLMTDSGFTLSLRNPYNNLGIIYKTRFQMDSAIYYYELAVPLYEESGDYYTLAACYNNLALAYEILQDTTNCLMYNRKAIEIRKEIGDVPGIATSWLNMGVIYQKAHRADLAAPYIRTAIHLADSMHMQSVLYQGYQELSLIDSMNGNFDSAFYHLKIALDHRDSMVNEEIDERLANMRIKYDTDEIQKQKELSDQQLEKEKTIRWLIIGGSCVVLFGLILLAFALRAVRKKNSLLATQRQEILLKNSALNEQNLIITEQKQQITDSINYAYTIQQSLLPSHDDLKAALPDSFVMFRPRDIISGDFYFVAQLNGSVIFIVADCTGHGVPGAMMSMLGVEEFQKAIAASQNPGEIIAEVNRCIRSALKQSQEGSSSRDGMDVAVCVLTGNKLQYSGAQRPLWICRNGELIEQKATKLSIGGLTPHDQVFETHNISLQFGDMIYLSSDGYADQFGGSEGKKLMTKNMKSLLCRISVMSTAEQKKELETQFQKWRGNAEQVDDVCVMGVRI